MAGKRCLWRFKPRGGYGFILRVPVTIESLTANTATVLVEQTGKRVVVARKSLIDPATMRHVGPAVEGDSRD